MRIFVRTILALFAFVITLTGCIQQSANVANNIPVNAATPAPASSPQIVKASASDADAIPVTLPVLDAFFADENFSAELKSKLQLTDEQVERLRKVAREETSRLRETETGEYSGTTSAARAQATAQIKEILGEEKTEQLSEFLR